ncbi:MAG: 3-ketoacyl-ACP reductase [Bacteroidetes bacterium]|nr:3-ketoacyl-ACP reductase [Bacteroidota bacterium]
MNARPVAVITGASRGIGRAIATALAREGFDIAAIARTVDSEAMESLAPEVNNLGSHFFPIGLDISHTERHAEVISLIQERYGRIDFLVNNAGVAPLHRSDILEMTEESYDMVTGVNLRGPVFFAQKVAREMIWLKGQYPDMRPAMVFITSISASLSSTNRGEYCISKAGLSLATTIFADRLAREGINVYEVRPGITRTDMTARVVEKYDKLIAQGLVPQGRWAMPEDIAKGVASIAGGDWEFSTGMVFEISGGMNIRSL